MKRETQNILLVLLGGALLKIALSGSYLRYVKPAHYWPLILAGGVILLLATISIARALRGRRDTDDADEPVGHHHPARSAWLLVLPVFAVFLVAPPALGSDTVERVADVPVRADGGTGLFPALPAAKELPLPLSAFVERAAWDKAGSLNDRTIRLTGFVVHEGQEVWMARIVTYCCAADAQPVKVHLVGGDLAGFADNSWLEATVRLVPGSATEATRYFPSATVHSAHPVPEPADPYEH